jgi:hypothetical protein
MCESEVNKQIRTHARILLAKLSYFSNYPKINKFFLLQFERTDCSRRGDRHGAVSASAPVQNSNMASSPEALTHRARRRNWTAEKSIRVEDLENELEAYAPLIKCETKGEKTYYKCPMRNRFECPMIVRTVR